MIRSEEWYLSQSLDGSHKEVSVEKQSQNKEKNKIPTFLQKKKDGMLPTNSKFSKEKSKVKER